MLPRLKTIRINEFKITVKFIKNTTICLSVLIPFNQHKSKNREEKNVAVLMVKPKFNRKKISCFN